MNKSKAEDEIFFGEHAETLTTNPAYVAAMTRLKARLFEQFGSTGFFQKRKREELWKMIRLVGSFEEELANMIDDSNLAKDNMKHEQRLKQAR